MLYIPEEVKDVLKKDSVRKNLRISFPNGEHEDITNDNLIAESMTFTESICSRDDFRLGLTESPTIEFETFNVDNIKGAEIDVSIEIDITDADYVTKTVKLFDGKGSFQVEAVDDIVVDNTRVDIDAYYVSDYEKVEAMTIVDVESGTQTLSFVEFFRPIIGEMIEVVITSKELSEVTVHYPVGNIREDLPYPYYSIPIGRFIVEECPRDAKLRQKRQVSAMGKGFDLEKVSLLEKAKRQALIGSTYSFSIPHYAACNVGLVDDSTVGWVQVETTTETASTIPVTQGFGSSRKIIYASVEYAVYNVEDYFRYIYKISNSATQNDIKNLLVGAFIYITDHLSYYDLWGGVLSIFESQLTSFLYPKVVSNVLGEVLLNDGTEYISPYLSDSIADYTFSIKVPKKITFHYGTEFGEISSLIYAEYSGVIEESRIDVGVNYPDYVIDEYKGEEIDFRPIFESYVELLGKFGKHNRYGKFVYHSINGGFALYPSETLYPSDTLYPTESPGTLERQDFVDLWFDDVQMLPYGKVVAKYNVGDTLQEISVNIVKEYAYTEPVEIGTYDITGKNVSASVSGITGNSIYIESDMPIKSVDITLGENLRENIPCEEGQTSAEWTGNVESITSITVNLQTATAYSGNITIVSYSKSEVYYSPTESREYRIEDNVILTTQNWTAEDVRDALKYLSNGIKDVVYVPTTLTAKGMPYIEAGDSVWIDDAELGLQTIVMRRTLSGIQSLMDDIESKG